MHFTIGDVVTWTSSANGSDVSKTGTILQVVPANARIPNLMDLLVDMDVSRYRRLDQSTVHGGRDHESYLVGVAGKTPTSKGAIYWPRVAALKHVTATKASQVAAAAIARELGSVDVSSVSLVDLVAQILERGVAIKALRLL